MLAIKRTICLLSLAVLFCLGSGSALAEKEEKLENVSGYLGPEVYALLEEVDTRRGTKVRRWISPKMSFANYKNILIEQVILYPEPQPGPQVSQETLDAVVTYLTEKLRDKIGSALNLTTEPGPEVVRLQAAVTGVSIETEGMKAYEVMPIAAVFGGLKAMTGNRAREVHVFLEIKVSDSESDEMVGAAVIRIEGDKLKNTRDQLQLRDLKKNLHVVGEDAEAAVRDLMAPQE
jgi:hypothetical protein